MSCIFNTHTAHYIRGCAQTLTGICWGTPRARALWHPSPLKSLWNPQWTWSLRGDESISLSHPLVRSPLCSLSLGPEPRRPPLWSTAPMLEQRDWCLRTEMHVEPHAHALRPEWITETGGYRLWRDVTYKWFTWYVLIWPYMIWHPTSGGQQVPWGPVAQ